MLLNLQSNAIKFTARGQIKVKVAIQGDEEGRELVASVQDTGAGISQAN